ncbi:MAG: formylglycine-generating enzyme family protein [Muribaculum sp.]|nr:formylglycine-generating enzyme family protein [Muribaculum sp.]
MTYKYFYTATMSLLLTSMMSCSSQTDLVEDTVLENNAPKTCAMILNASKPGFDSGTRADEGWENGDKIFLLFSVGNEQSRGDAVYKDGIWTVSYYGNLTAGGMNNCKAVYFDNPDYESGTIVNLSANTGIYEAPEGNYVYNDGTLTVTAVLSPKTARVRFEGAEGVSVKVLGVSHYSSYDCTTGNFGTSVEPVDMTVANGYTPYFYGYFPGDEQPRLAMLANGSGFTKILTQSIFLPGQSGYMTIPSVESHAGWENIVTLKANGVEYNMIPVEYGEGNFLLAETEVTNALYNAVLGQSKTPSNVPYVDTNDSGRDDFMSKLSILVGLNFDYPTVDEWYYAAKGGKYSKDYTYAGSDIIDDVAWYNGNSGNKIHEVRQLQPNELGFYDMSGNAYERVRMQSNASSFWSVGGCYNDYAKACVINDVPKNGDSYPSYRGLRPIVRFQ